MKIEDIFKKENKKDIRYDDDCKFDPQSKEREKQKCLQ